MAILGQFFTRFPLFFESCLILLKTWLEIFPDNAGILRPPAPPEQPVKWKRCKKCTS